MQYHFSHTSVLGGHVTYSKVQLQLHIIMCYHKYQHIVTWKELPWLMLCGCMSCDHVHAQHGYKYSCVAFKPLNLQMAEKQASTCMPLNKLLECLQNTIIIMLLTMEFPLNGTIGAKTPGKASSNTKLYSNVKIIEPLKMTCLHILYCKQKLHGALRPMNYIYRQLFLRYRLMSLKQKLARNQVCYATTR